VREILDKPKGEFSNQRNSPAIGSRGERRLLQRGVIQPRLEAPGETEREEIRGALTEDLGGDPEDDSAERHLQKLDDDRTGEAVTDDGD
jgi:hypothetical protein